MICCLYFYLNISLVERLFLQASFFENIANKSSHSQPAAAGTPLRGARALHVMQMRYT